MIQSIVPEVIKHGCGGFTTIREWIRQFMEQYMCGTYCVATIVANKLPLDWFSQGCTMVYKVVYLVKAYFTPPTFVVNNDKIGVHFVPNGGEII
jgi:hypothetical protein